MMTSWARSRASSVSPRRLPPDAVTVAIVARGACWTFVAVWAKDGPRPAVSSSARLPGQPGPNSATVRTRVRFAVKALGAQAPHLNQKRTAVLIKEGQRLSLQLNGTSIEAVNVFTRQPRPGHPLPRGSHQSAGGGDCIRFHSSGAPWRMPYHLSEIVCRCSSWFPRPNTSLVEELTMDLA